jgi:hypothetical protein
MVSNYTGFNFTGDEQFDGKVGDSLPDTLYIGGKSFAVYPRSGIRIGENAVLGERTFLTRAIFLAKKDFNRETFFELVARLRDAV